MSSKPEIIKISSDSTSTSSDELMSPPPWNIPPGVNPNKVISKPMVEASNSTDSNSISSYVSSYQSTSSEEYQPVSSKKGTTASACKKVSRSVNPPGKDKHVATQSLSINGKRIQVLGLANKETYEAILEKRMTVVVLDSDIFANLGSIDALNVLSTMPFLQLSPGSKVKGTTDISPVITPTVEGTNELSPVITPTVEGTTETKKSNDKKKATTKRKTTETASPIATTRSKGKKQRLEEQEAKENKNKWEEKKKQVIGTVTGKRKRVVKDKKEVDKKKKVAKRKGNKKLEDEDDMNDEEAVVEKKKAKGKGKKKVEEEEDEDEGRGKYFKSLLRLKKLSPERKQRVREMGFGSLLGFPFDKIPTKLPYFVLKNLNVETMKVNLPNGGVIKITPRKIREVLGIPMGPIPFYAKNKRLTQDSVYCQFMAQLPKNNRQRTTTALSERIQKSEGTDFIFDLSYLMLFANCLGSCKNTIMLKYDVLENVKSSEDIPNIDWCTFIWNYIKESKEKWDDRTHENWCYGPHVTFTLSNNLL
ncbi:hypothetical protein CTI12_AA406480 [Artemisia annua]|uniref:Uncharacterized protein n=1 Tax=Artemisia annua TaxID=35608 RepID=A0A2U1M996_ARTAN|nr:hypothetical protein CTI12_AA406480 [Artemisia annua]